MNKFFRNPQYNKLIGINSNLSIFIHSIDKDFLHDRYQNQFDNLPSKTMIFLIKYKNPPKVGTRNDGHVLSFILTLPTDELPIFTCSPDLICYQITSWFLMNRFDLRFKVIQIGKKINNQKTSFDLPKSSIVIPHKGDYLYLQTCLNNISNDIINRNQVKVCLDQEFTEEYKNLYRSFPQIKWYKVEPYPAGPYVIRNRLIKDSDCDFIIFQDSDDIPCVDRFESLSSYISQTKVDLVGSHELRVDEIEENIQAIRFPLDVSNALSKEAKHPQLHPTTIIRKDVFERVGYFSTLNKFGSDTQFLLRAHFYLNIKNIDSFLYIRRKRINSLTTSKETGIFSPQRLALDKKWKRDFENVKSNNITLKNTTLDFQENTMQYNFSVI